MKVIIMLAICILLLSGCFPDVPDSRYEYVGKVKEIISTAGKPIVITENNETIVLAYAGRLQIGSDIYYKADVGIYVIRGTVKVHNLTKG